MENVKLMFVFKGFKKGSRTMQIISSPRDTEKLGLFFAKRSTRLVQKQTCMREEKYTGKGVSRSKERKTVLLTNFSMPLVCTSKKRCHLRSSLTTDYKSSECIAAA